MTEVLLIFALVVFVLGWAVQTAVVLERRKNLGDIVATALFFTGLVLFTLYGFQVSDPWFIMFNSAAVILALINFYYIPHKAASFRKEVKVLEKEVIGFKHSYSHKRRKK